MNRYINYTLFYKQLVSGSSPQSCLHFQDFQGSKHTTCIARWNDVETTVFTSFQRGIHVVCFHNGCLVFWKNKQISSVFQWFFQHSSLAYCIPLVKDQIIIYEIRSLSICINIKAFNMFTQSIKFYTFFCHVSKSADVWKRWLSNR